jgi:hypothetical protein
VTQRFSGPWVIAPDTVSPIGSYRYVIQGSDSSDGEYDLPWSGGTPPVSVSGDDWALQIQALIGGDWSQDEADPPLPGGGETSAAVFAPQTGLVRTVGTGTLAYNAPPPPGAFEFSGARLRCTSLDPDLSPGPMPPHPDFTVPGEG